MVDMFAVQLSVQTCLCCIVIATSLEVPVLTFGSSHCTYLIQTAAVTVFSLFP